ncbi:MAG TPA: hypothetical protein VGB88_12805, partial [Alphaproteobacteria bacterium]
MAAAPLRASACRLMMAARDLPAYPEGPGWRDNEASIAAAEAMAADAPTIRARVLRAIAGA